MIQKSRRKKIRDDIFYYIVLGMVKLLRMIPRRTSIFLMRAIGRLVHFFAGNVRRRTVSHLHRAYGSEKTSSEIKKIARGVFLHFSTTLADIIRMPNILKSGLDKMITAEGIQHLDQALAPGKGAIMITAHFGNWELLGAWLAKKGYPLKVVGTALHDPRLDRIVVGIRNQAGYYNIARGKATREILRWLKEGNPVGMLIDQDTKVQGTFVRFFDQPTYTPTGAAQLARKLNLPIIPVFMRLTEDFNYHIECMPPLDQARTENEEQDIIDNTQKCSDIYETIIRRFPAQWVWMHKRWKTTPENPVP